MAARTRALARAGSGGCGGGAWPAAARSRTRASWAATSASVSPPTTKAPRSGALRLTVTGLAGFAAVGVPAAEVPGAPSAAPAWRSALACRSTVAGSSAAGSPYRPGTYSSSTAWKLVPPKPNALTAPRRTPDGGTGQSRSLVLTWNGDAAQSTLGLGSRKFRLGGRTLSRSDMIILNRPAAPAALFRWPMFDFTEPSAMEPGATPEPPKTALRLSSSEASPTRVDVPCASMKEAVDGSAPALRQT